MLNTKHRWQALNKWQKLLAKLALSLTLITTYIAWQYNRMPGVALYVHNETATPIFSYFVNDNWGGNAAANGGSGMTCCWKIEGSSLKIQWIKSMTLTQYKQGAREETITLNMPNPPRKRSDRYLHVHFFPGDQVRLAWSSNLETPYENIKEIPSTPATKD